MEGKNASATTLSRRAFLKLSGGLAGAAAAGAGDLLALREASAAEVADIARKLGNVEVKYTADVMCPSECGLEMWVKDGRLYKIYGNKACPFNDGTICGKGSSGAQMVYSPHRMKYPMIRVGERGEGKFRRATWEEAIDHIARKLVEIKKTHGPEAVIMDAGDVTDRDHYWRPFFAFGTPNCVEHGAICDTPRRHGPKLMLEGKRIEPDIMRPVLVRQPDGRLVNDYSYKTKLIIYAGWNPFVATRIFYETRGTVGARVENGCKVIVVDPAYTNTASKADQWLPIRPGTDPDLFAAMLRYILENDNPADPKRKYIDWDFKKYSLGWDEFLAAFRSWWTKKDPVNGLDYFSLEWAAQRTGFTQEQIAELAHTFGITKPAALIWGMNGTGHHYNGYMASILGTALNVITGNFDVPGGAIDTEIVKASKGGSATGKQFNGRKVTRVIGGKAVEGKQEELHMDAFGDWPAAWDDVVGDYPRRFLEGVTLRYGPFRGHRYPIKGYILRTGNSVITGSATWKWQEALTAKGKDGKYLVDLVVYIDTPYLESGLYADVLLPEASYAERVSLSDIYPSHPVIYLRDQVIPPLYESRTPTDIMNMLARRLHELGDPDIKPADFWERYRSQDDFVNEMLQPAPGRANVGQPLPYPNLPEGYTLFGTPDSLEAGRVQIDHQRKVVRGEPVTAAWLRAHKGVAVWPMSWHRYRTFDKTRNEFVANKVFPGTGSKLIEFKFNKYAKYNKLIEEAKEVPRGLKEIGFSKYPDTFYWFETMWNPFTNPAYRKYAAEFPFQLVSGRVHHAMSGTQMVPWLAETRSEGLWRELNEPFQYTVTEVNRRADRRYAAGDRFTPKAEIFVEGTWSVGTVEMNPADAGRLGVKMGDLIELTNPLGKSVRSKAFVTNGIRPGTLRMGFATGGRFGPGLGPTFAQRHYTPDLNMLMDPDALSPIMGQPAYVDMLVKVQKV